MKKMLHLCCFNVYQILGELFHHTFEISIKALVKTSLYQLIKDVCSNSKEIQPIMKNDKWNSWSNKEKLHNLSQRWLRSKKELNMKRKRKNDETNDDPKNSIEINQDTPIIIIPDGSIDEALKNLII